MFRFVLKYLIGLGCLIGPFTAVASGEMAERLQACTACHGESGRSVGDEYYPSIAGKPAGYLYQQLLNFREGRRHQADMQRMLAYLSEAYLQEIAEHFAAQDVAVIQNSDRAQMDGDGEVAAALVNKGDPERDIPACGSCHGEGLTGQGDYIPGLLGLPADYVAAQLGAWQVGSRSARDPDCMAKIAKMLTGTEIVAIADWIAEQPVSSDYKPAPPSKAALPMACGAVMP